MEDILKKLFIIQEVSNKDKDPKLGRGFSTAMRFNPFNPLSYITLLIITIIGIMLFGVVGFWDKTDKGRNPFKWD